MSNSVLPREAVHVKVKKCEINTPPEWRKFSVDPQIISLEVLYSLLAKAFDIKSDFSIKYKAYNPADINGALPYFANGYKATYERERMRFQLCDYT
ncbi:TBC1 domain family member 25-like [Glossina fuscipes]|uniref:TBC1 domain family member 25-like n=1 Tax=Glossina fuscipes TaxID=7396 RepID=A0A9C6DQ51_9MUSC|nr:TBC1 domain family member 25-like [Glossina fuscipes]